MLDIKQKYWVHFGHLYVRCSVVMAHILYSPPRLDGDSTKNSLDPEDIRKDIKKLNISQKSRELLFNQVMSFINAAKVYEDNYPLLEHMSFAFIAYPDEHENILALHELEAERYPVFYDVDEPIGHSLSEDEMDLDVPPTETLDDLRKEYVKSKKDLEAYPEKIPGVDWLEVGEEPEPEPYWSEETLLEVSALFFKHDLLDLVSHGVPKDEYIGWASQLRDRLELEERLRSPFPNLPDDSPCYKFNKYQLAEQIARVDEFYNNMEGSVLPKYRNMEVIGYSEPRLIPAKRSDYFDMALELHAILYEKG